MDIPIIPLERFVEMGFASFSDLERSGHVKQKVNKGKNEFGFTEYELTDTQGNIWDYIPEDGIYELRAK
jgi:hypothetical protein